MIEEQEILSKIDYLQKFQNLRVFVGGVSGCGKTTIGKILAKKLNFQFIDGDDFHSNENRFKMSQNIELTDEDRLPWLNLLAKLEPQAQGLIIACSALKKTYRQILHNKKLLSKCYIVMLDVKKDKLIERLDSRKNHFFDKRLLDSQLATLELPTKKNHYNNLFYFSNEESFLLVVDSNESINDTVINIINGLYVKFKQ